MSKNLKNLLLEIHDPLLTEQSEILNNKIELWKHGQEQVDDIWVVGMKI